MRRAGEGCITCNEWEPRAALRLQGSNRGLGKAGESARLGARHS